MPRKRPPRDDESVEPFDPARVLGGWRRTESRRDGMWNVQPMTGQQAVKVYVCPGCGGGIAAGTPHLVAWRADGLFGAEQDLAERRHWHSRCWEIGA